MKNIIKNKKVVVAMSGGVDSSVAAALLKQQGYDVIGITMQLWPDNKRSNGCCSLSAVEDARRVASQLEIPYYVLNFKDIFKKHVIDNFISEYNRGRTPNPCVVCNEKIKFDALLRKAKELGAQYLATGHYARISRLRNGRFTVRQGKDRNKDQSYFLYPLSQKALSMTLFPVGDLTKIEVRDIAKKLGLKVADKKESQEICFVEGSYKGLFSPKEGLIVDKKGKVLGKHKGYQLYTVGQRRGLGISGQKPSYVVKIEAKSNKLTVGDKGDVYSDDLTVSNIKLSAIDKISRPVHVKSMIRYNSPKMSAKLLPLSQGKMRVTFNDPQFAITPGQSIVFYQSDKVLGGGIIDKTNKGNRANKA